MNRKKIFIIVILNSFARRCGVCVCASHALGLVENFSVAANLLSFVFFQFQLRVVASELRTEPGDATFRAALLSDFPWSLTKTRFDVENVAIILVATWEEFLGKI